MPFINFPGLAYVIRCQKPALPPTGVVYSISGLIVITHKTRQRERQRQRETDTETVTERQTQRQREKERQRETDRH